jgi:hypothetical protein
VTLLVSILSGADVVMQNIANISPKTWNQMTKVRKILTMKLFSVFKKGLKRRKKRTTCHIVVFGFSKWLGDEK